MPAVLRPGFHPSDTDLASSNVIAVQHQFTGLISYRDIVSNHTGEAAHLRWDQHSQSPWTISCEAIATQARPDLLSHLLGPRIETRLQISYGYSDDHIDRY